MTEPTSVAAALSDFVAAVERELPFAAIRHENSPVVDLYLGTLGVAEHLADVPLRDQRHRGADVLVAVPFRQVFERGFVAHDDGTPLVYLTVERHVKVSIADFVATFPPDLVHLEDAAYDLDDASYAEMVRRIVLDEIGEGEGANFVVRRTLTGRIPNWSGRQALATLTSLLEMERGAYWTFAVNLGQRILVGASPERHISARGGTVTMNPISGTFRFPKDPLDAAQLRNRLESFLADEKEILELMMVVDEELKMMASLCPDGGRVIGPLLKQMSHLIHTEYILEGDSSKPALDLVRESMFAATVVGSPVENACRVVAEHEGTGRGYYGAVLAEIGRDDDGETLDAPIIIRTVDVAADGQARVSVGATLVRGSVPDEEVAETQAKLRGLMGALGVGVAGGSAGGWPDVHDIVPANSPLLMSRNDRLSNFWISRGAVDTDTSRFDGLTVALVSAGDDFANMLAHMLRVLGAEVRQLSWLEAKGEDDFAETLLVVGPGPGDPRDRTERMEVLRGLVGSRLASGRPLLAVCLGHQILAEALGLSLGRKREVVQGVQQRVPTFGMPRLGGFYNTFTAIDPPDGLVGCEISADDGEVITLRGPGYASLQFHLESILTPDGLDILVEALDSALGAAIWALTGKGHSSERG